MISLIVAVARNRVIGHAGGLPWHLSDDLREFKRLTIGKPIVMGRKTFESIGKALPGRHNIVVSRDPAYRAVNCSVAASLDEALKLDPAPEILIIGGAELYRKAVPIADRIYLTEVAAEVPGDVLFPAYDEHAWQEVARRHHPADERHRHAFDWVVLERKKSFRK